jgi:hypothetical protein
MSRLTITDDDILEQTEGGKTIFEKVLGEIPNKCINSPLREDNNPSFSVFLANNGLWMYKDFSNGDSGSAITFISKLHNISYLEAVDFIKGLKIEFNTTKPVIKEKKELIIDFVDMPFDKKGHQYWNEYELTEEFLRKNNVFQVKMYSINKKIIRHNDDRVIFAYLAIDGKVKLLNIGDNVDKSEKWKSNVKSDYLWYYEDYVKSSCNNLLLSKSVKDSLVLKYINRCSVAVQSENAKPIIKNCVEKLEKITKNIYVCFGSDLQGKTESLALTQATGWKHFNTKDQYLKKYGVNDFAGLVKTYNMAKLDRDLKEKEL